MKHQVILLLGSNLGDRLNQIEKAVAEISRYIGHLRTTSSLYETEPWGTAKQPDFLNQVVVVESNLSPEAVLKKSLEIEAKQGRLRQEKWGSRIIDIDILFYDALEINTPSLTIPHPFVHKRKFALIPLMEILPQWIHPVYGKTISQLYADLDDDLQVRRVTPGSIQNHSAP